MALAVARQYQEEEGDEIPESSSSTIRRSPEQEKARLERLRLQRKEGYRPVSSTLSATEGESKQGEGEINNAQQEDRTRFVRAQVILASQEEAHNQIEKEEKLKPSALRYAPAGAVAVLKDLLDLIGIGSVPLLGTLVSLILGGAMFICLVFAKKNGSIQDMRFIIRRLLIVLASFLIEGFIFGVNFLPFELATVILIYYMDKHLSISQIAFLKNIVQSLDKKRV